MKDDGLVIYVVYDRPKDFPEEVVVRGQKSGPDGKILYQTYARRFGTVEEARRYLEAVGLYKIQRDPGDDPCIVESWI